MAVSKELVLKMAGDYKTMTLFAVAERYGYSSSMSVWRQFTKYGIPMREAKRIKGSHYNGISTHSELVEYMISDWNTGLFTLIDLSDKYGYSSAAICNYFQEIGINIPHRITKVHVVRPECVEGKIFCGFCKVYKEFIFFTSYDAQYYYEHSDNPYYWRTYWCKDCKNSHMRQPRINALNKIAKNHSIPMKCVDCNITELKKLEIAYTDDTNHTQLVETDYNGSTYAFYNAVVKGRISTHNLTIKCANHNILDEHINGYRDINSRGAQLRIDSLTALAQRKGISLRCQGKNCDEDDMRVLTHGHINNDGAKDYKDNGAFKFYKGIINGTRVVDDLTIYCINCQQE